MLLPGHYLVWNGKELYVKPYWEAKFEPDYSKTTEEWVALIRDTVKKIVDEDNDVKVDDSSSAEEFLDAVNKYRGSKDEGRYTSEKPKSIKVINGIAGLSIEEKKDYSSYIIIGCVIAIMVLIMIISLIMEKLSRQRCSLFHIYPKQ